MANDILDFDETGGIKGGPGAYMPETENGDGKVHSTVGGANTDIKNSTADVTHAPVVGDDVDPSAIDNIKGGPGSSTDPFVNGEIQTGTAEVKPDADASGTVAGGGQAGGGVAPAASVEEPKMVPTHNLEDRGRADDSVIAGILKKAGIDAKDDAKRDRINKIMASVGAGMNMLQAIANIGAASRNNGRFVGNIDVAKGIGDGVLADTARRKERDAARQTAIDKRAAMLDAQDAEQRKAEREAAAKALDFQRTMQKQSWQNAFTAAENEKKRRAEAEKAEKDRLSREKTAAEKLKADNANKAADRAQKERHHKEDLDVKKENIENLKEYRAQQIQKAGGTKYTAENSMYVGLDANGKPEFIDIPKVTFGSKAPTGEFGKALDEMLNHPDFQKFMEDNSEYFDEIATIVNKVKVYDANKIRTSDKFKDAAKLAEMMELFLSRGEKEGKVDPTFVDSSPEATKRMVEYLKQLAAKTGGTSGGGTSGGSGGGNAGGGASSNNAGGVNYGDMLEDDGPETV